MDGGVQRFFSLVDCISYSSRSKRENEICSRLSVLGYNMTPGNDNSIHMNEIGSKMKNGTGPVEKTKAADFDTAVSATGYGKFHYILFLVIIPASWSSSFDTMNASMILTSAECDLELSLLRKGLLNAITYAGMVSSALVWGFLADVMGRRNILVYGFLADGICNALNGLSQNFTVLILLKFMSGLITSGPYATLMTYCAEFHSSKDRPRIVLSVGLVCAAGCIVNAGLAWMIIPRGWVLSFGNGAFIYNSWRIFLTLCSVPILIGGVCLFFFPESPKFLMSQGRNAEALEVFKTMFKFNTGQPRENYPIRTLQIEQTANDTSATDSLKKIFYDGLLQMKPLFYRPYLARLLIVFTLQFCGLFICGTLRSWQPQIFTILKDYDPSESNITANTFCEILDYSTADNVNQTNEKGVYDTDECIQKPMVESVYSDTMIVSSVTVACLSVAGVFVNLMGNKNLLLISYVVPMLAVVYMNWSTSSIVTLILTCMPIGLLTTTVSLVIGVIVDLFPTTLRTMAVSLTMMVGRIGAIVGNIMFPVLLDCGCFVALMSFAGCLLVACVVTLLIRKPKETIT